MAKTSIHSKTARFILEGTIINPPRNTLQRIFVWSRIKKEVNMLIQFFMGVIAGALGSLLIMLYHERATQPKLMIGLDRNDPLVRQKWCGYHLLVNNCRGWWFFVTRRPAWNTRATIDVLDANRENRAITETIQARWSRSPEPVLQAGNGVLMADFSRIFLGRQTNIFANDPQQLDIAIKYDNDRYCYIWSNESYLDGGIGGRRKEWELDQGVYRLVVRIFYEIGTIEKTFLLHNNGISKDSVRLTELNSR